MIEDLAYKLEMLFVEAGSAHHRAFIDVNGEDAAWALWYANYVHERLSILLKKRFDPNQLAEQLEQLEKERKAFGIRPWAKYYAEAFMDKSSVLAHP